MISKDLIKQARQANLADYLIYKGINLIRNGTRYRHPIHSSLVFTENAYYWNSKNESGNSIDYLTKYMKLGFKQAVEELTKIKNSNQQPTEKSFNDIVLTQNYKRAFGYLNQTRNISNNIILELIEKKHLFIDERNNIAFPMYDENNIIVGYELQGTLTYKKFKGIAPRSKYGYGFNIKTSDNIENAYYFESAIDLLSYYQLHKDDLNNSILISLAGLKDNIIIYTSKAYKSILRHFICVDNDIPGTNFKNALKGKIKALNWQNISPPEQFKDWNEYLQFNIKK